MNIRSPKQQNISANCKRASYSNDQYTQKQKLVSERHRMEYKKKNFRCEKKREIRYTDLYSNRTNKKSNVHIKYRTNIQRRLYF